MSKIHVDLRLVEKF